MVSSHCESIFKGSNLQLRTGLQDKILQSTGRGQNIMVTNDGATILKSLYVDNPAAKVLVGEAQILK